MKLVLLLVAVGVAMAFVPARNGLTRLKSSLRSEVDSDKAAPLVDRVRARSVWLWSGAMALSCCDRVSISMCG